MTTLELITFFTSAIGYGLVLGIIIALLFVWLRF